MTNIDDLDLNKHYTYADYLTWNFWERVELIKGRLFKMSPAPNTYHQDILGKLFNPIFTFFNSGNCKVFPAPFDVRIPTPPAMKKNDEDIESVIQPDITVICDMEKIDRRGCLGAPDWIIEIASPSTKKKDMENKFELYETSGVKEYWMVFPEEREIKAYHLNDEMKFVPNKDNYLRDEISPHLFPELKIYLSDLFPEMSLSEEPWPENYVRL